MNVFGYYVKVWSEHDYIVNYSVAYDEQKTGKVNILLIHKAIEMKGLHHNFLTFFAPYNVETAYAIQICNYVDTTDIKR